MGLSEDSKKQEKNGREAHNESADACNEASSGDKEESLEEASLDQVFARLEVDPRKGLSRSEAQERIKKYGKNKIEEESKNPISKFFSHFWGPIPWMIEVAVILSAIAQKWEDFAVIFTMLLINGGVSFWHENKADSAIEALKERLALEARVLRDGERINLPAEKLVPGDVVVLRMGDVVPADARLIEGKGLSVDESMLTGESLPVDKNRGDMIYSGTTVKRGEMKAVTTATGAKTRFARTVELVQTADEISHFQQAVLRIGYFLIGLTAAMVAVIVAVGWLRGDPLWDLLLFALVLTIAGIPQALPAVLTITMTVGAHRLARMKAIVSRLPVMEEMAGLEVLCVDKTGTLTLNELKLQQPIVMDADDEKDLIVAGALTCRREDQEDPIDRAVLSGLENQEELSAYRIEDFRPFDPTRKRAEADVEKNGKRFTVAKGAPQVILNLVPSDSRLKEQIEQKVDQLGKDGFRALGVARKREGEDWRYLGILPLLDPPRRDSAAVLEDAGRHNIDVRMVTGDHGAIARQVAMQVGMGQNILNADDVFPQSRDSVNNAPKTIDRILKADGFAEVTPEHKFQIIKHFQDNDRIIGMTGDGVNDAPALKQADVGVAVSGATDAARAASALVLTEPGLAVITKAVEEARRIFMRMTSYATFRIIETMRVLLFIAFSILAFNFYPITPIMIVLLAILNDIPIMTIAADNAKTPENPVRWNMRWVIALAAIMSIAGVFSSLLLFWYLKNPLGLPLDQLQTMLFLKLLVAGHMTIFLTRNDGWLWEKPWPAWPLFMALEGTQIVGTLAAVYGILMPSIGWMAALGIWAYALVWLFLLNAVKVLAVCWLSNAWSEN